MDETHEGDVQNIESVQKSVSLASDLELFHQHDDHEYRSHVPGEDESDKILRQFEQHQVRQKTKKREPSKLPIILDAHNGKKSAKPKISSDLSIAVVMGRCSRCKKEFVQDGPKPFRTCAHCRELQRKRSRRWQLRTREKEGVCTRCGVEIPEEANQFVLCPHCRQSLRSRKIARKLQGKCVHCSAPLEEGEQHQYKVCFRCRELDRHRRRYLEDNGACIRCAKSLANESGRFKVCDLCRERHNNPNLMPNARIPNILTAAYKQELSRVRNQQEASLDPNSQGSQPGTEFDYVLRAAQSMGANYEHDDVSATAAAVLSLTDDNNLLENNYFTIDKS